jgi:chorismate mutase
MRIAATFVLVLALFSGGCVRSTETPTTATEGKSAQARATVDRLLELMCQRLLLQHEVARYKWHAKLPITDAKREQDLLAKIEKQGVALGLEGEFLQRFYEAQILAGKLIQQADFDRWQEMAQAPPNTGPDLPTLRQQIDELNQELLQALAQARPWLRHGAGQQVLENRSHILLRGKGITDEVRRVACNPLQLSAWLAIAVEVNTTA